MTTKTAFAKFCYINGLRNKELAEYLGTSSQFVSLMRRGEKVPGRVYDLIVRNDKGWDTTPLTEEINTGENEPSDNNPISVLRTQLRKKDEQIEKLLNIISKLADKQDL